MSKENNKSSLNTLVTGIICVIIGIAILSISVLFGVIFIVIGAIITITGIGTIYNKSNIKHKKLKEHKSSEQIEVVGEYYYENTLVKALTECDDWNKSFEELKSEGKLNKRIYKYEQKINGSVQLVHEKNNPHDENAIIVFIAGNKVGYIPASENVRILKSMDSNEIDYISAFKDTGGPYKVYFENGDYITDEYGYNIIITIYYKQ